MQKPPAVQNKLIQKLQEDAKRKLHKENLQRVKSSVDQSCPYSFRFAKFNHKGNQIQIERFSEIERENRILLERMSNIRRKRQRVSHSTRPVRKNKDRKRRKQKELMELTIQNYALLKRLQNKKPFCTLEKWQNDRIQTENIIKNISEYPYQPTAHLQKQRLNSSMSLRKLDQSDMTSQRNMSRAKLEPIRIPTNPQVETKLEQYYFLGNQQFHIEIQTDQMQIKLRNLWIIAVDSKPERFTLELPYQDALILMGGRQRYKSLLRLLELENGELVLCEPTVK